MSQCLPTIVEAQGPLDIVQWLKGSKQLIENQVAQSGAVLVRGLVETESAEAQFKQIVQQFSNDPLEYVYRSTPRTDLGGGVYTATEYPPGLRIPQHNENAFQREWPLRLLFLCVQPADGGGGQTPLANTLKVTARIDEAVKEKFSEKGVLYIRNYHPDVDLPWQIVFQTESKEGVESYCRRHGLYFEWLSPNRLRTKQVCQAFARHPRTGDLLWFNQAHLFHPSSQDARTLALLRETFADEDLPRNACYGDGSPIETSALQDIRAAFEVETVAFDWQAGDLLILDNMMISHGRAPYKGKRKVLAAMCNPYKLEQL